MKGDAIQEEERGRTLKLKAGRGKKLQKENYSKKKCKGALFQIAFLSLSFIYFLFRSILKI